MGSLNKVLRCLSSLGADFHPRKSEKILGYEPPSIADHTAVVELSITTEADVHVLERGKLNIDHPHDMTPQCCQQKLKIQNFQIICFLASHRADFHKISLRSRHGRVVDGLVDAYISRQDRDGVFFAVLGGCWGNGAYREEGQGRMSGGGHNARVLEFM